MKVKLLKMFDVILKDIKKKMEGIINQWMLLKWKLSMNVVYW